jgi:hypothetical protein
MLMSFFDHFCKNPLPPPLHLPNTLRAPRTLTSLPTPPPHLPPCPPPPRGGFGRGRASPWCSGGGKDVPRTLLPGGDDIEDAPAPLLLLLLLRRREELLAPELLAFSTGCEAGRARRSSPPPPSHCRSGNSSAERSLTAAEELGPRGSPSAGAEAAPSPVAEAGSGARRPVLPTTVTSCETASMTSFSSLSLPQCG